MGRQKQTKLPKNTHHKNTLPSFYLPLLWNSSFFLSSSNKLLSTLIHSSIVRSQLSSPFSTLTLHPRETKLCYLHLPLWLFGIKIKSLSVLKCTFHPCDFWLDFSRSILSSFPYSKNCSGTEESDTSFALFVLTRANCDQLIPFPFSAKKNTLPPSIGRSH